MLENLPDKELVTLVRQNNAAAFEEVYNRYWEELFKLANYMLRDGTASADLIQDIFSWFWEKRHALDVEHLRSYLKAAVKFKIANYIRSGKMRESFFEEVSLNHHINAPVNTDELVEIKELKAIIQKAIDELPEKCRQIFLLKREQGLNNFQIAEHLGLSVKTVENQITIALKRIRSAVDPYLICLLLTPFSIQS